LAEVQGEDFSSLFIPEDYQSGLGNRMQKVLTGKPIRALENPIICKDGTPRWMICNAQYLTDYQDSPAILFVGHDITSLKQAQNQVVQAERLAAIGQMMTGLAHESGNALARSQACLEMLSLEVEDRPDVLDLVARIQKAQNALQQLYEEVQGYAAPLKLDLEKWDLSGTWRQAWADLAVVRQKRDAVLQEKITEVDLRCSVDQFRMAQVFRNMLENSLAACADPVIIEILCSEAKIRGKPGIRIRVQDNGPGLSPEQKARIFEPFYTTKTKGTGLGMPIAKRIVEAHGGSIEVGNGPRPGAEIIVALPRDST
jgi:signal transduction histidine kinase